MKNAMFAVLFAVSFASGLAAQAVPAPAPQPQPAPAAQPAPVPAPAAKPEAKTNAFSARVIKLDGPADEVELQLPNNGGSPEIKLEMNIPEGTRIITGDATVIVSFETMENGQKRQNSAMSIRPVSNILVDRCALSQDSVITRVMVKTGEVRVKITEERPDYATDMKVATPNATASITGTDCQAIGYNNNSGTFCQVASGSIAAARDNGTTRSVGEGNTITGGDTSALDANMTQGQVLAPIGMVAFEVKVGQLSIAGIPRPASDVNNAATNPTGEHGTGDGETTSGNGNGIPDGQTLPSHGGRGSRNRR